MDFKNTQCCGIQEITGLSHHPSAEDAMDGFCACHFGSARKVSYHGISARVETLYSFYLFTAAIYPPGRAHTSYTRPYGPEFAAFIKANKLGDITPTKARVNLAFHPDHSVQAWLWCPAPKLLKAWWAARQVAQAAKAAEKQAAQLARDVARDAATLTSRWAKV